MSDKPASLGNPVELASIKARGRLCGERFHLPAEPLGELVSRSPANPADLLGVFPYGREDVHEATMAASRAARAWAHVPLEQRLLGLDGLRPELIRCGPELVRCMARETGRPVWECQREVAGLVSRIDQVCSDAPQLLADRGYGDLPARVMSVPLGVVAVLGPAMLPLSTSHTHIMAALAAGNTVVWKPSPHCPATAQLYAEIVHMSGLYPGAFNLVQGDDEVGWALSHDARVDATVFTGTTGHGRALRKSFGERFEHKLILHLSAKNAAVVMEDADLELAAYEVVTSAFQSAGQRCTATSRVLVHRAILDEFIARLLDQTAALRIGAASKDVFMGPMLSEARLQTFLGRRAAAQDQGAEPLRAGERLDQPGHFATPSLHLVRKRLHDSDYQQQELFGPDLAIYPVADLDDALHLCDAGPYGLCAALFTQSPQRWRRFCEELRVGSLLWNRGTGSPSGRMPFGGAKASGGGLLGGADAMAALRREVSLLGRTSELIERLPGTDVDPHPPHRGNEVPQ
jgi:acyl-CoA reductase-like NAD-dependent aldehyde dehydrogenase